MHRKDTITKSLSSVILCNIIQNKVQNNSSCTSQPLLYNQSMTLKALSAHVSLEKAEQIQCLQQIIISLLKLSTAVYHTSLN